MIDIYWTGLVKCPHSRSRSSNERHSGPDSQESDAPPVAAASKTEPDYKEQGNKLFKDGKYQAAIQKYEAAVKSARCCLEDKAKCYRLVTLESELYIDSHHLATSPTVSTRGGSSGRRWTPHSKLLRSSRTSGVATLAVLKLS